MVEQFADQCRIYAASILKRSQGNILMNIKTTVISILMLSIAGCATTSHRGNAIRDRLEETPGLATHNISIDEEFSPGMVTSKRERILRPRPKYNRASG